MKNNKFYTVEKEINGTTYKAQFAGLSCALKAVDSSYIDGTNTTSVEKIADYIFKNIIVEPAGLSIDDFDSLEEFNEVVTFGREVMQGVHKNFRNKKDATGDKE